MNIKENKKYNYPIFTEQTTEIHKILHQSLKDDIKVIYFPFSIKGLTEKHLEEYEDFKKNYKKSNKFEMIANTLNQQINLLEKDKINIFRDIYSDVYKFEGKTAKYKDILDRVLNKIIEEKKDFNLNNVCLEVYNNSINMSEYEQSFLFDRLSPFKREKSMEYKLVGTNNGMSVEELLNDLLVLDLYAFEETFKRLIGLYLIKNIYDSSKEETILILQGFEELKDSNIFKDIYNQSEEKHLYIHHFL